MEESPSARAHDQTFEQMPLIPIWLHTRSDRWILDNDFNWLIFDIIMDQGESEASEDLKIQNKK